MSERSRGGGLAGETAGWQAQKSAATRALILEAAIRCLAEAGHAGTTTHAIAATAGLSRGAMLHHFPAKDDVLQATAVHLVAVRPAALRKALGRTERSASGHTRRVLVACAAYARLPQSVAARELAAALRSEPAVAVAEESCARDWRAQVRSALAPLVVTDAALELTRLAFESLAREPLVPEPLLAELERLLQPPARGG